MSIYFVEPSTICDGGRTESEFTEQGTGYMVALQRSADPTDYDEIPLTTADAAAGVSKLMQ